MTESLFILFGAASTTAWAVAYGLMIRRGLRDHSYGMPMIALCLNVSWEAYFTFFADLPMAARAGNGAFLLFDLGVLYTCFRFGRKDFDWPLLTGHFTAILTATLGIAFVLVYVFISSFNDYGILITLLLQLNYSTLLIAMLIRRNSVKGQSLYIGLLILLGDACGLYTAPYTQKMYQPDVPLTWIFTVYGYVLLAHIAYLLLYVHVARRDGIDPWRRL